MAATSFDALGSHWRTALDAAEDALGTLSRNRRELQLPSDELQERARLLVRERSETEHLLEQVAQLTHARLHRHLTGPRARPELIGLDGAVRACVFDLDGVLTASSALHAASWQETFDPLLARRHEHSGEAFGPWRPFDPRGDYERYIHGRPRIEGVHAFLASRGIRLPEGNPGDPADAETAQGLANRKNAALQRRLGVDGVKAFEGSTRFLEVAHEAGLRCAVVSASANTDAILRGAGLAPLVDVVVDGRSIGREQLAAKPAPDSVLAACRLLDVPPGSAATFETTLAGIDAGRAAGVHRVIGVDRSGRTAVLVRRGADRVVPDLGDLIDPVLGD
ncbi:MAG TPA: HAD family hydrolase [Gaiellaceae bacterium]|nr:HAD family hydrolase [Gaiellaceae bacterium]